MTCNFNTLVWSIRCHFIDEVILQAYDSMTRCALLPRLIFYSVFRYFFSPRIINQNLFCYPLFMHHFYVVCPILSVLFFRLHYIYKRKENCNSNMAVTGATASWNVVWFRQRHSPPEVRRRFGHFAKGFFRTVKKCVQWSALHARRQETLCKVSETSTNSRRRLMRFKPEED